MIDLFAIFGKGGIVLWCFQGTQQILTPSINALIRNIFLEERGNTSVYQHDGHILKFKLDNEFDLVFVVVYSNVVQLAYTDKLLSDVHLEFRDAYKNVLEDTTKLYRLSGKDYFAGFEKSFSKLVKVAQEDASKVASAKTMRGFDQSDKSQKTVNSMIIHPAGAEKGKGTKGAPAAAATKPKKPTPGSTKSNKENEHEKVEEEEKNFVEPKNGKAGGELSEVEKNRLEFMKKMAGAPKKSPKPKSEPEKGKKNVKQARKWNEEHKAEDLDYSRPKEGKETDSNGNTAESTYNPDFEMRGSMKGQIHDIDEGEEESSEEEEVQEEKVAKSGKGFGLFSAFKSLVGNKKLTLEDIQPALDKMRDHLISKNVATEIADKLTQSVATQLEGKVIGTFSGVAATVKSTLRESLVHILSPQRRVDILRDIAEAKHQHRPYTVVFCGVNGVGKSTNLAKITFWLSENGHRVMIAACDTFRAGAVEQLRTHTRHLNALHPNSVTLYDQGYGKDAAGVAAQAISQATSNGFDVVLVDTAGRMQDNEPLMRALSKLIKVNNPDLVLFVGEALVGNEAVDQLEKFNQALADHATPGLKARLIDGIVLTKFDTIDDKVGAAVSMTYITGQPIVFVGTGQTYKDLKNLNANAVVSALLK